MKVVVTGASGLTGRLVAMRLVENGHDVVGVARHPATVPGVRIVAGDCGGPMTMAPLLDRADALVHVAGILHGARVAALPGTARLPHLVAVSSAGVHSRHRRSATAYLAGEMALRAAHPEPVIIRPTMIYGSSRDRNIHHVIAFAHRLGALPLIGPGDSLLQPIHYEDLASAVAALLTARTSEPLDAGGGDTVTIRDALTAILRILGRPPRLVPIPRGIALVAAHVVDGVRGGRWAERLERLLEDRAVDNDTLTQLTGLRPRSLAAGLRAEVAEMRAEGVLR